GKAYNAQRGILDPGVSSPEIPNFMTRWRLTVGTFRTKVSNNHTNKMKKYNNEVGGAKKYGGGATTVGDVTEARDGSGRVVERFIKPRKRPLTELLGEDLTRFAEVKRPKTARTRTATGDSAASGAAYGGTAAVGVMPSIPKEPAVQEELPAIQDPAVIQEEAAPIQEKPTIQEEPALRYEEEGSGSLAVSDGQSNPGPDIQPQQPADFMAFFNFDRYLNRNQPIAGESGGNGGSQAAQGSGAAGESYS
ncbi:hypothetical protein N0V85_008240, partial [Neurospora sp. IMI 360204]